MSKIQETRYPCTFLIEELRLPITYLPEGDPPTSLQGVSDTPNQTLCWSSCKEFVNFQTRYEEDIFYNKGFETLKQVAQRGGKCLIPGNIHGYVGWGSEQLGLLEDFPACCRGVRL